MYTFLVLCLVSPFDLYMKSTFPFSCCNVRILVLNDRLIWCESAVGQGVGERSSLLVCFSVLLSLCCRLWGAVCKIPPSSYCRPVAAAAEWCTHTYTTHTCTHIHVCSIVYCATACSSSHYCTPQTAIALNVAVQYGHLVDSCSRCPKRLWGQPLSLSCVVQAHYVLQAKSRTQEAVPPDRCWHATSVSIWASPWACFKINIWPWETCEQAKTP